MCAVCALSLPSLVVVVAHDVGQGELLLHHHLRVLAVPRRGRLRGGTIRHGRYGKAWQPVAREGM